MDTDKNSTPTAGAAAESKDGTDSFTKVKSKKSQKRKREQDGVDMDTEESVASKRPQFPPISGDKLKGPDEMRKIPVPAHRYTPLKENWLKIFTPIVENLQLQVRFNLKTRHVEIKTCKETQDIASLTKATDFVKAFILGFQIEVSTLTEGLFFVTSVPKPDVEDFTLLVILMFYQTFNISKVSAVSKIKPPGNRSFCRCFYFAHV
uniref:RNA-binding protein PNO1 isoform X2 n=1 Tax=Scatophagus argus TaxID=75038 RepID=UPI001ED80B00|nr:RNA-binding protein PNO1 isoform X2 [Scatophagus argus]